MSDTNSPSVEARAPSGIADTRLEFDVDTEAFDSDEAPFVIHGVAIGADEFTLGAGGPKFWPSEELRRAVESLVGTPLNVDHVDDAVDAVVGEVVAAEFEPDVGIIFEAELDDATLATKVARGRLEVSIHALHRLDGTYAGPVPDAEALPPGLTPQTAMEADVARDVEFLDLSLVPRGGAPSNDVRAGSSPSEALASYGIDNAVALFAEESSMSDQTDTPDPEESSAENEPDVEPDEEAEVESEPDTGVDEEAEAGSEPDAEATAEADVDAESEPDEGVETELERLQVENERLRAELNEVRLDMAEELATGTPFEADELAGSFDYATLKEKFEAEEASLVGTDETAESETTTGSPAPRTGDEGDAELEASSGPDTEEQIAELESKIETYEEMGWDDAKQSAQNQLAELQTE
jgi:pilus assembly protein FimV